jgi:cobalt-zinc-cadmium efflux system membrane fusion protein
MKVRYAALLLLMACHSHDHDDHESGGHAHRPTDDRPDLSFTHWTDKTELFIELPALVRGQDSPGAAHVTILEPFSALARGEVTAVLLGPSGEERFASNAPSVPGIFRPVIKPAKPGMRRLVVQIRSEGWVTDHDLGDVMVYPDVAAARAAHPEEAEPAGRITFLKEQQWPIEFATALVQERAIRPTLRASGTTRARSDGEVLVVAPAAGRVASSGASFPTLGQRVNANDLLGVLAPRLEAADLASLDLAVKSAELELRFAERERQRLENLRGEGAVPERRVQDAVHAAEGARASLETAQRRRDQFRRVERTSGGGESGVQLRAPISGTVTEVHLAPGTFVEAGTPILRITDLTQLWLEVRVPEVDITRLGTPRGASVSIGGNAEALELPAESLVARGQAVDPITRTLALLFAIDNAGARFPLGAYGRVFVVTGEERRAAAVPESAIVDDSGTDVVYVQVEGEAFERRIVRLGARDRGFVEVLNGLDVGEHVATRGAWSVKLAASSGSVPAHGHSH